MTFVIITHVPHKKEEGHYFAYAPYVREMNIWGNYVAKMKIVAPISAQSKSPIDLPYEHSNIEFTTIASFDILTLKGIFNTILKAPKIFCQLFMAMKKADHIHLRCPGNIGLLACIVQIVFPNTPKTAKYAGNWDPKSKQPWTYRLQKWIISNTFLTRNMKVLVYGQWEGNSKNVTPFFTASYTEADKAPVLIREWDKTIHFVFVGALVNGKNPLYAIQLVQQLHIEGHEVELTLYGEGILRSILEKYILDHQLQGFVSLAGNQTQEVVKQAYQKSHFVVLPSDSEGWPKVVAEGMFWGCVPLSTAVSCVPFMLDYGERGILLEMNLENDYQYLTGLLADASRLDSMQKSAITWSRYYTTDVFEVEIKKLMLPKKTPPPSPSQEGSKPLRVTNSPIERG